jgi:hypothetical protein
LALAASSFKTSMFPNLKFEVEVRNRPSIPDNLKHWRVFKDDEEIQIFFKTIEEFSNISIDQDGEDAEADIYVEEVLQDKIVGHKIIELKTNHLPKGLVPLKRLFDHNDVSKKAVIQTEETNVVDCDISLDENPRLVKISRKLSQKQKEAYVELMKHYSDIFTWSYEDLKVFDTEIIQHKIPLKPGSKPIKQKFRQFNPLFVTNNRKRVEEAVGSKNHSATKILRMGSKPCTR